MFRLTFLVLTICALLHPGFAQVLPSPITLPNGWSLSPAGRSFPLGDLPLNMALSQSKKYLAVTNNGQSTQSIQLIDIKKEKVIDSVQIAKSWYGLQFSKDGRGLYASGGHDNKILYYSIDDTHLSLADSFILGRPWPNRIGPAGLAIDESRNRMYVVTREDKQLYLIDLKTHKTLGAYGLEGEGYTCILSPDGNELYISCWGCDQVLLFDLKTNSWKTPIPVGDNPNEMLINPKQNVLYICNANDNSVSVIDLQTKRVIETMDAALFPNSPSGTTPNGLSLDQKNKTLCIANADNNCLALFDVSKKGNSKAKGFIPVGWYPTNVKTVGQNIWVSNGKGFTSKANPFGPSPLRPSEEVIHHGGIMKAGSDVEYIGGLFQGTMSIISVPGADQLAKYTQAVYRNTPYTLDKLTSADRQAPGYPIPMHKGQTSPIKYVFYIIKENRTYDQVLADAPGGNGDTTLLLFGKNITPNQHALVSQFVLCDNFYVNAEVSADGHNWSMGAYANDYLEKTWPSSYGSRGGTYGGEGEREIANNKNGFIWNNCHRYGVTYRTYGEFADSKKANIPILENHFCTEYPGYNLSIKDTTRFRVWKKEFDSLVEKHQVPQFNTLRFGNDHTEGLRKGKPTPYAHVADNDLAVGLFVEALANSPIWNESVVFILEDDAQNGADHVDAHRSPVYIAGGFVKRGYIDHTPYSTASVLRTMELILGMEPMTQYDAAALPFWRCFDSLPKPSNFKAILPEIDLNEKNVVLNEWQRRSEGFDFVKEDTNNDLEFSRVLWHGLKGDTPFPGPRRAGFIIPLAEGDKD
ncbi:MAG: bifunctional YncE family protein/alkaline phosphatase family protein [Saprospiraceae bacterium]|nr:bifunctional YncE family protein/alkaline phosphatase family protein [Saprospiraceae bacterium]MBK7436317.1 bifunctional YncE family protein/alkaline phosphatase family protein [Saprospiraceae bacterium]